MYNQPYIKFLLDKYCFSILLSKHLWVGIPILEENCFSIQNKNSLKKVNKIFGQRSEPCDWVKPNIYTN